MGTRKTIVATADTGDRLETLKALRHKIARAIQNSSSGRDIAALSRQLREVMDEIESAQPAAPAEEAENVTVLELVRKKHVKEA